MAVRMEEEAAEDLRYTRCEVPVEDGPKHLSAEPLAEFHDTFLMTAWAEVPLLAGDCEEPLGSAPMNDSKVRFSWPAMIFHPGQCDRGP